MKYLPILLLTCLWHVSAAETTPREDATFFNGENLNGWKGNDGFWSVKDGAIVGHSDANIARNEFIWSEVPVTDFYLSLEVKLTPNTCNAGIQFRSKPVNDHGQAHGYQADVGKGVWGRLYHEHGRGKLDWTDKGEAAVKPGEWNHYEIIAIGDEIRTAINGVRSVTLKDPKGERTGKIALQIHGGPPQTVSYRKLTLIHHPDVKKLKKFFSDKTQPRIKARGAAVAPSSATPNWKSLVNARDKGSQGEAWAQPDLDHGKWKTMKLPGHYENAGLPDFDGVVWFRKTLELTDAQAEAKATLHLGQIDDMDVSWVNGTRVGGYEVPGHHYTVRKYAVPKGILKAGKNTIAVRVTDHGSPGGIAGLPGQLALQLGDDRISLANTWHFKAGATVARLTATAAPGTTSTTDQSRSATNIGPFKKGFELQANDVIACIGGSGMVKQFASGALELLLTQAAGDQPVFFRDLSWQADTVYQRQRPRNFGTQAQMLERIQATMVIAAFGQMEVLDGVEKIPDFIQAYEVLLDELPTKKIVLVTPYPFSQVDSLPYLPKLTKHNASVKAYAAAITDLAKRRGAIAVDLSSFKTGGITTDGIQLTPEGHKRMAALVTRQLLGEPAALPPANAAVLLQQIQAKNVLWKRHWRPTNWAFLYGNRQQVPSSKDHRPGQPRWFPKEVDAIIPLIEEAEADIFALRSSSH